MGFQQLFLFLVFLSTAAAQFGEWKENQINTSICTWEIPRAALIRDTIYIDGGRLYWSPGLNDGQYGDPVAESFVERLIWTYNLSHPIDKETNVTTLLVNTTLEKQSNGLGANFQDGAMLADDYEFLLFGGSIQRASAEYEPPDSDTILGYQIFRQGAERTWVQKWDDVNLGDDTTRYITYGAGVSAPSEHKAWYFSGMTSPTHSDIEIGWFGNGSTVAQNISRSFIQVDMTRQSSEVWTNVTLPPDVKGRAGPEAVWVPVGEQGILVVLGGVTYPHWATESRQSENPERSRRESPAFMEDIDIYDVASRNWYKQSTTGGPGARTRGCAVLATASDQSSFNIYYYGGFDGISPLDPYYDDVWVLSLPSFTWTQLDKGEDSHARAGHKCFTPYGDQMMVFGGSRSLPGQTLSCLKPGPFAFFNMSSGEWVDSYHPNEHSKYRVPDKVVDRIGGDAAGGATLTTPEPSGWADDGLKEIFEKDYDTAKISTWGPFSAAESPTGQPDPPRDDSDDNDGGGGLPSWVAPVLGVVLGLMVLTGALVVFFVWRKRRIFRNDPNAGSSDASTEDTGKRIIQWIKGQPAQQPVEKAPTVTTSEETPASPETRSVSALKSDAYPSPPPEGGIFYETAGNPVAELPDNSRAELSDTHSDDYIRRSYLAQHGRSVSPSHPAGGLEANSTISGSSGAAAAAAPEQAESPVAPNHGPYRASDPSHMRSLSETLAGPMALTYAEGQSSEQGESSRPGLATRRQSDQISEPPVSPPTSGDFQVEDYLAARGGVVSPVMRKSVFHESEEDMEKK